MSAPDISINLYNEKNRPLFCVVSFAFSQLSIEVKDIATEKPARIRNKHQAQKIGKIGCIKIVNIEQAAATM